MERLWSPWRLAYVTGEVGAGTGGSNVSCLFCDASAESSRDDLVLIRNPLSYVILNLYPYNNGHLMVVPNRHVATLASSTADELGDLMRLTRHAEIALAEAYKPQGINVGINLGAPAGAGVVGSPACASGAALDRRHELHVGHRQYPRAARGADADRRPAAADLRTPRQRTTFNRRAREARRVKPCVLLS